MLFTPPVTSALATRSDYRMPLVHSGSVDSGLAKESAGDLFPQARSPQGAQAGLVLYLGGWEQAHTIVQDLETPEGYYWHGIVHRQEPDPGNAAYWFRRLGVHPIFAGLLEDARAIASSHPEAKLRLPRVWDPIAFIEICDSGSKAAIEMQHAEWTRLFEWCATPKS